LVEDGKLGESSLVPAEPEQALQVFHHPYAHAPNLRLTRRAHDCHSSSKGGNDAVLADQEDPLSHHGALRAGDYRPQLKRVAKDVRFRFPGSSSWATELEGKDELERWLQRFARVGLQIFPDEVVAKGSPWKTRLMVRGTIHLETPVGETVFENRYVIWGRMSWGLLREYEVYEDTEKSTALDEYLASSGELDPAVGAASAA
jgi:hypothetical protein